jgi:hypothetical protein
MNARRLSALLFLALVVSLFSLAEPLPVRAAADLPAEVEAYQHLLERLSAADGTQVPQAIETYRATFAKSPEGVRDAAFLVFRSYWARVRDTQDKACQAAQDEAERKHPDMLFGEFFEQLTRDMAELSSSTLYVQAGLRAYPGAEGTFHVAERPGFFLSNFKTQVSPGTREFLELELAEATKPWASEGQIVVTWSELGERMATWERHLAKYEKSPLHSSAQAYYRAISRAYLVGLPNSPIWDYETHEVLPEVRAAFPKYVADHGKLASGKAVAEELAIFKKCNFKMNDDAMDELAGLVLRLGLK